MSAIEALHIFDEHNNHILTHTYSGRPPPAATLLPLYLAHPSPRPSLIYLPSTNPPTLLYSIIQDRLLFLSPCSSDTEPLLVLEFLHRVADALEEFLGSPLLARRISSSHDVVAQIVAEIADAGVVVQGEANALRDVVETGPGTLKNLLSGVGISAGSAPASASGKLQRSIPSALSSQASAIPWRRSAVRHTSNELYVDIVETLSVTLAPSGRPLSAFAAGSVAFTSKVSGVPDLLLTLSAPGSSGRGDGRGALLRQVMQRAVFHPCVRLARWRGEGVLSFVPPDGRFALCGYEADLLGDDFSYASSGSSNALNLPASISVATSLGAACSDFEVRLLLPPGALARRSPAAQSLHSHLSSRPGAFRSADSKAPDVDALVVRVPLPPGVRGVADLRASCGDAHWSPADAAVEWRVDARGAAAAATLRCTVLGPPPRERESGGVDGLVRATGEYDDDVASRAVAAVPGDGAARERRAGLMPSSATLSFAIKGWLASGLRVESLLLDVGRSRGLGADVKPYKGVKYLTVSREGVEARC